jgi:hypothetical protein
LTAAILERRETEMAVWKRYNGKRVKGEGPKGKGIWIVEFRLRGLHIKQAIPEARTKSQAEQAQTKIKRDIFDDKYNRAAGNEDFAEFADKVFVHHFDSSPLKRVSDLSEVQ